MHDKVTDNNSVIDKNIKKKPIVSIGVPCYNRPKELDRLLAQLSLQNYRELEILVSDNASPDNEVISVAEKHSLRDNRIKAFRQDKNLGMMGNHDFLLNKATGKYFLWVHDDDELPLNYVEICVKHLEDNPEAVLIGPGCDRYLEDKFWYTYENWSSVGRTTFERLRDLIYYAYLGHWEFEQYFSGVFLRSAAPKFMSRDFKSQLYLFFFLSEAGSILHAQELRLVKHTTQENLEKYEKGTPYKRHGLLRFFYDDTAVSLQQCFPITFQMFEIIFYSKRLRYQEKYRLSIRILYFFFRYSVRDEVERRGFHTILSFLKKISRKFDTPKKPKGI